VKMEEYVDTSIKQEPIAGGDVEPSQSTAVAIKREQDAEQTMPGAEEPEAGEAQGVEIKEEPIDD
jgi:hypothetical protein